MNGGEFDGKVAIVTGAASGLGRATAYAFAQAGAKLALVDVNVDGLEETAGRARDMGCEAMTIRTDLCDAAACRDVAPRAEEGFGRLDALCNVAGAFGFDHAMAINPDAWDKIFAVNVRGPFFIIQSALPHLIKSGGAIVNVASASAFFGHAYLTHYAASKAALVNLTKSLAMEFIHSSVRINAIAPGGINTAMTAAPRIPEGLDFQLMARYSPLRGSSDPEDLTDLILMLAGPRGKAFHGDCVNADRGITAG